MLSAQLKQQEEWLESAGQALAERTTQADALRAQVCKLEDEAK